jgi:hypothetical protein
VCNMSLAFLGVFSYLAARFHYPEVLDGRAHDVLPALLATGTPGRADSGASGLVDELDKTLINDRTHEIVVHWGLPTISRFLALG